MIGLGQVVLVRGLRMKRQPAGRSSAGPYPLSLAGALRRPGEQSEVVAFRHGLWRYRIAVCNAAEGPDRSVDNLLTTAAVTRQHGVLARDRCRREMAAAVWLAGSPVWTRKNAGCC